MCILALGGYTMTNKLSNNRRVRCSWSNTRATALATYTRRIQLACQPLLCVRIRRQPTQEHTCMNRIGSCSVRPQGVMKVPADRSKPSGAVSWLQNTKYIRSCSQSRPCRSVQSMPVVLRHPARSVRASCAAHYKLQDILSGSSRQTNDACLWRYIQYGYVQNLVASPAQVLCSEGITAATGSKSGRTPLAALNSRPMIHPIPRCVHRATTHIALISHELTRKASFQNIVTGATYSEKTKTSLRTAFPQFAAACRKHDHVPVACPGSHPCPAIRVCIAAPRASSG